MKWVVALAVLITGAAVEASCPSVVRHVVQQKVLAVQVPLYSVGYYGHGDGNLAEEIRKLRKEIQELRQSLQAGLTDSGAVALMKNKCASCHGAEKASGGFTMFTGDGELVNLGGNSLAKVAGQVGTRHMPKNGKLTDEEFNLIMSFVAQKSSTLKGESK